MSGLVAGTHLSRRRTYVWIDRATHEPRRRIRRDSLCRDRALRHGPEVRPLIPEKPVASSPREAGGGPATRCVCSCFAFLLAPRRGGFCAVEQRRCPEESSRAHASRVDSFALGAGNEDVRQERDELVERAEVSDASRGDVLGATDHPPGRRRPAVEVQYERSVGWQVEPGRCGRRAPSGSRRFPRSLHERDHRSPHRHTRWNRRQVTVRTR
jgi:hypothetical protein